MCQRGRTWVVAAGVGVCEGGFGDAVGALPQCCTLPKVGLGVWQRTRAVSVPPTERPGLHVVRRNAQLRRPSGS